MVDVNDHLGIFHRYFDDSLYIKAPTKYRIKSLEMVSFQVLPLVMITFGILELLKTKL